MRHPYARVLAVPAITGLLASSAVTPLVAADQHDSSARERGSIDSSGPRPPGKYRGLNSGEWLAVWWQENLAAAVEGGHHPLIDAGAVGDNNRTVFLVGPVLPADSARVTTRVTIPSGTHLVVPIITVECSEAEEPPFHGDDEAQLRACANDLLDQASEPSMRIDGRLVKDPHTYRVETPLFRYGPLTANNYLGLPAGTQSDAVGAGYVLVLQPLSVGVHRIRVAANVFAFGLAADTEFIITVEPQRR